MNLIRRRPGAAGLLTRKRNQVWKGVLADVSNPGWLAFVLQKLAAPAAERGFDGFFLDTADSIALLARTARQRAAYRKHLTDIHSRTPSGIPRKKNRHQPRLPKSFPIWRVSSMEC